LSDDDDDDDDDDEGAVVVPPPRSPTVPLESSRLLAPAARMHRNASRRDLSARS
jgi:hypothetical protein